MILVTIIRPYSKRFSASRTWSSGSTFTRKIL